MKLIASQGQPAKMCFDYLDKCPCILAEIKRCPQCSHLNGEELCHCQWVGVCIFDNVRWQDGAPLTAPPTGNALRPVKTFQLDQKTMLVYGQVASETVCNTGLFECIYLKGGKRPDHVRILGVVVEKFWDQQLLAMLVPTVDFKHKYYLRTETEFSLRNTLQQAVWGQEKMNSLYRSPIMLIAAGWGAHMAPYLASAFIQKGNRPVLYLDQQPTYVPGGTEFNLKVYPMDSRTLRELTVNNDFDYLAVLGPSSLYRKVIEALITSHKQVPIAVLNSYLF